MLSLPLIDLAESFLMSRIKSLCDLHGPKTRHSNLVIFKA